MDTKRLELHEILCKIVNITEPDGDRHVYFNPPESVKMKYPAIRYSRSTINSRYANNGVYRQRKAYDIYVIDKNPDSEITDAVALLPECRHVRSYKADNLNHDMFTINY